MVWLKKNLVWLSSWLLVLAFVAVQTISSFHTQSDTPVFLKSQSFQKQKNTSSISVFKAKCKLCTVFLKKRSYWLYCNLLPLVVVAGHAITLLNQNQQSLINNLVNASKNKGPPALIC